jgi:hypothetical protein
MADSPSPPSGFTRGQRWLTTVNLLLATLAVLAIGVMFNYLAGGHFKRFHWANLTNYQLSPQTRRVLNSLTNDVEVTIFFDPERQADLYSMAAAMLAEYQNTNPRHVRVGTLDYTRSLGEARALLDRLHLAGSGQKDFVAFECKSTGQSKICYAMSLAHLDISDLANIRRDAFNGEVYFTSDLYAVSHPGTRRAYFLAGHGERDPGDPSGKGPSPGNTGYSKFAAILKDEVNCDWQRLSLQGTNAIPADCQLLILASPQEPRANFTSNEIARIQDYLKNNNGRLFALLDVDMGLTPVLTNWGVALGSRPVEELDPDFRFSQYDFLAHLFPHEIVSALASQGMTVHLWAPLPAGPMRTASTAPGAPMVKVVAATSTNNGTDGVQRGCFPLIAAVEHGVINDRSGTRIVVAGDADFLDDQHIDEGANHYFANLALNWLLQRPDPLLGDLGPRPIKEYKLFLTESQTRRVRWLFLAGMPGAVLFLGSLVWLRRRS